MRLARHNGDAAYSQNAIARCDSAFVNCAGLIAEETRCAHFEGCVDVIKAAHVESGIAKRCDVAGRGSCAGGAGAQAAVDGSSLSAVLQCMHG